MAIFLVYNERTISEKEVYMDRRNFLKTSLMGLVPAAVASPASALATPAATPAPQKGMGSFKTSAKYPMVDSHLHYVDFLQQTDGLKKNNRRDGQLRCCTFCSFRNADGKDVGCECSAKTFLLQVQ